MKGMLSGFIHHFQYNLITDFHEDDLLKTKKALVWSDNFNEKSLNSSDFFCSHFSKIYVC